MHKKFFFLICQIYPQKEIIQEDASVDELYSTSVQETEVNNKKKLFQHYEAFDFHQTRYLCFLFSQVDLETRKRELESVFKEMESEEEVK